MQQIDDEFLIRAGLGGMLVEERQALLLCIDSELQLRIGSELAKNMSDEQLIYFEELIEQNQKDQALQWLKQNCPNYQQSVALQIQNLQNEILDKKDAILGAI